LRRRDGKSSFNSVPQWSPIPAWRWIIGTVVAVGIVTAAVTISLLGVAREAAPGTDRANARLDAVRTGLAAGGGTAAAVGLLLAFRRQYHQEVATLLTNQDATERRVTELYANAAEELGSDRAPVRLAGLYTLERLAQENADHRQTVINLICAYLRAPFDAPPRPRDHKKSTSRLPVKIPAALGIPRTRRNFWSGLPRRRSLPITSIPPN
jgi:hypothetical protein